jgi:2-amino-4-hydroxy-6-hydroxymethyldihydropteridine diphosphokinase
MKNRIFILLGSNIDKERNLPAAIQCLQNWCQVAAVSDIYESHPVGLKDQPNFFNAAVLVESNMDARTFRRAILNKIESRLKRVRTSEKNAPRTIDADMVLFNDEVFDLDLDHHIPDPELLKHVHVIVPVAQLNPEFVHPETGETLGDIAQRLTKEVEFRGGDELRRLSEAALKSGIS